MTKPTLSISISSPNLGFGSSVIRSLRFNQSMLVGERLLRWAQRSIPSRVVAGADHRQDVLLVGARSSLSATGARDCVTPRYAHQRAATSRGIVPRPICVPPRRRPYSRFRRPNSFGALGLAFATLTGSTGNGLLLHAAPSVLPTEQRGLLFPNMLLRQSHGGTGQGIRSILIAATERSAARS